VQSQFYKSMRRVSVVLHQISMMHRDVMRLLLLAAFAVALKAQDTTKDSAPFAAPVPQTMCERCAKAPVTGVECLRFCNIGTRGLPLAEFFSVGSHMHDCMCVCIAVCMQRASALCKLLLGRMLSTCMLQLHYLLLFECTAFFCCTDSRRIRSLKTKWQFRQSTDCSHITSVSAHCTCTNACGEKVIRNAFIPDTFECTRAYMRAHTDTTTRTSCPFRLISAAHLYIHIYVCIDVYRYISIYYFELDIHTHIHLHMCIYVYMYILYVYVYVYICTYIYTYYIHLYVYVHIYTCICICTYIYLYIYMSIYVFMSV